MGCGVKDEMNPLPEMRPKMENDRRIFTAAPTLSEWPTTRPERAVHFPDSRVQERQARKLDESAIAETITTLLPSQNRNGKG